MKTYRYIGNLNISKKSETGFLIPIYELDNIKYAIEIDDFNIVEDFVEIDERTKEYINYNNKLNTEIYDSIGEEATYFFKFGNNVLHGIKNKLKEKLGANFSFFIDELSSYDRYDLFDFMGISSLANREKESINNKNINLVEHLNTNVPKKNELFHFNEVITLFNKSNYSHILNRYPNLQNIFHEKKSYIELNNSFVSKKNFNLYLESTFVINSLKTRFSIEIYIVIKKQCGGKIDNLAKLDSLTYNRLSSVPELKILYKDYLQKEKWDFDSDEMFIINKLDSMTNSNNSISPSLLNVKFENSRINSPNKKSFKGISKNELEKVKDLLIKNNL